MSSVWRLIDENNKDIRNIRNIFPTKQNGVALRLRAALKTGKVIYAIVFGSSVSNRCNPWSDIDIYFELSSPFEFGEPYDLMTEQDDSATDLWTNYDVDEGLLKEIQETGVLVYER